MKGRELFSNTGCFKKQCDVEMASTFTCPDHLRFFSLGISEDPGLCPPLPANVNELKQRITIALETVAQDMLHRAWEELDYRLDLCRVTGGAHIEHL